MRAHAMIAVWMNVAKEHDQEFNDWYETEHLAEVVAIDGILSGRRYCNPDGELRYLVLYEAIENTIESGAGFQAMLTKPTPWTVRIRKLCDKPSKRSNFRIRHDTGNAGDTGALLAIHSADGPGAAAPQSSRDALEGCLRYRAFEDAIRPGAWLELYEFENLASVPVSRAMLPGRKDTHAETYQAIGTPKVRAST